MSEADPGRRAARVTTEPGQHNSAHGPVVAVVTITLNDPVGIRRTVASVAAQDSADYEHVVVDGGSGPEVVDWLREWQSADPERRRLVTDPPRGIYPSMNVGIRRSSAPLVVVVNGGDELLPGAIGRVAAHHSAHRWRWAYGGLFVREADGRPVGNYTPGPFSMARFRAGLDVVPHGAAYVTRDLYEEIGLYREDIGPSADQEFFLRAANVVRPARIPGLLAVFEMGGTSSQQGGILFRERDWHRLRLASGTAFGGRSVTDGIVTAGLLGFQVARWGTAKILHTPYPAPIDNTSPIPDEDPTPLHR